MLMTKRCGKCGETKTADEFSPDRRRKDGLQSHCKECKKAKEAARRAADPDKASAVSAAYRAANPDKEKARFAARRAGGRDPDMPWSEAPVGYDAAHSRVVAIYGSAKNHACNLCDGPAAEWAYDHDDPDEYSGPMLDARRGSSRVMRWSGKPQHYMPLCHPCHVKYDRKKESAA